MENLLWGITVVVISSIIFVFAYLQFRRNNHKLALTLIILAGLILRVYVASDQYLHQWDERYHALVAKNLIKHPLKPTLYDDPLFKFNHSDWIANHVWLEKGPVPLWAISTSLKIFGVNEFAIRIPSIILSLLAVYLTYLIALALFNKKVALLAAFLHAINGLFIVLAGGRISSDHVETFFIFFIELAIFIAIVHLKNKRMHFPVLIGIATGLAFLSKWSPALIVFPVYFTGLVLSNKFNLKEIIQVFLLSISSFLIIVLPWMLFIHNHYPEEARWVMQKFLFAYNEPVDGHKGSWYFYIHYIGILFGELIYIPLLYSLYQIIKSKANWGLIMLTIWWLLPVLVFSLAVTKRYTYLMIAAPAFIIILAYYWFYFYKLIKGVKYPVIIYLLLFGLLASPVNFCITQSKAFQKRERSPQWVIDIKAFKRHYRSEGKTVIFNLDHEIEAIFYTGYTVYDFIPKQKDIDRLIKDGYHIIVNDDLSSDKVKRLQNVELIEISKYRD